MGQSPTAAIECRLTAFGCASTFRLTVLSIDVMDISGEHLDDVKHDITRQRLDHGGRHVEEPKGGKFALGAP